MNAIDAEVSVETDDETASITYCTFSKWGGLRRVRDCFDRNDLRRLKKRKVLGKVKYDCGIKF